MGFRAVEIDALLRAAQIEQDRHAQAAKAASLSSDDAYPTPGRGKPDAASCEAPPLAAPTQPTAAAS